MTGKETPNIGYKLPGLTEISQNMPEDKETKRKRRVNDRSLPFIEKYRPESLPEVIGQVHLQDSFRDIVEKGLKEVNFGNLLFTGPHGVGKTSIARIIPAEIIGPQWRNNFLEVNVPQNNYNLDFINKDLTNFIKAAPTNGAKIKFVLLDECDALNTEARKALRKIVEDKKYRYVRYILASNAPASQFKLLLGGRFIVLEFHEISNEIMKAYLKYICALEDIKSDIYAKEEIKSKDDINLDLIFDLIVEAADGCLREGLALLDDLTNFNKIIQLQKVKNRLAYIESPKVEKLLEKAIHNQDYLKYYNEEILKQNLSIPKLLDKIANLIDNLKVDPQEKRYIVNQLGIYSFRINQGTDQTLQMKCFLNSLANFHDNLARIQDS